MQYINLNNFKKQLRVRGDDLEGKALAGGTGFSSLSPCNAEQFDISPVRHLPNKWRPKIPGS